MQRCASIILALLQQGEAGDRSVTGQLMYTAQQWNQERPCFNKGDRKKVTGYHACKAKLESFSSLWLRELLTMTLRGTVFITLRPTVMSLSGVGERHLVTFVLAMPSTADLVMYLGMLRLMESPECVWRQTWLSGGQGLKSTMESTPASCPLISTYMLCMYAHMYTSVPLDSFMWTHAHMHTATNSQNHGKCKNNSILELNIESVVTQEWKGIHSTEHMKKKC